MEKTIWCHRVLILLWLCGIVSCQDKTENRPVANPVLSTSNMMMPVVNSNAVENAAGDAVVYVCKSPGVKRYHLNRECHGLKKCKHEIEDIQKQIAENVGLTMCGYEY